ncbi:MAG TPA: FG-GAP-like repeat-containing protein [Acidobacteriaceae bacterium]
MIGTQRRRSSRTAVLAAGVLFAANIGLIHLACAQAAGSSSPVRPTAPASFVTAPSIALGYAPAAMAAGDLTGSGHTDLVAADSTTGEVVVYLSDGHGGFAAPVRFTAVANPQAVAIADIDGDGRPDVIVASATTGAIAVLPGRGNGTLGNPRSVALGFNAGSLIAGDLTGNGHTDVAVAGLTTRAVAVLVNDGKGNLAKPVLLATAQLPTGLAVSDFNHDGHADIAVAQADGSVEIFLGQGGGQFRASAEVRGVTGPITSISAGDFNRDGNADLAVTAANGNAVAVLLGKGDGTFAMPANYAVGSLPARVFVADTDGDGIPDLIVVNRGSNTFSVLKGSGDGTFDPAQNFVAGNGPEELAAGAFYGSGHVDLAVLNQAGQTMSVAAANGDGTFFAARSYTVGERPAAVAAGDVNGDGRPDLVVAKSCSAEASCGTSGSAVVLLGQADGTYQMGASYALGAGPVTIALIDVNGDKHPDLVAANRLDKTLTVRLGLGDGTFGQAMTTVLAGAPRAVAAGSFHGKGTMDLAVVEDCGSTNCSDPGQVEILRAAGDGNFQSAALYPAGYAPVGLAGGSLDGSGNAEIVVANRCGANADCSAGGTATVLLGDGAGNFKAGKSFGLGPNPAALALGDLTGSGVLDAVVARGSDNALVVFRGKGDGTFASGVAYQAGMGPGAIAIADFTGDGKPDVAVVNSGDSTVSLFAGKGDGTLQAPQAVTVGSGPTAMAVIMGNSGSRPGLATANGNPGGTTPGQDVTVLASWLPAVPLPTPTATLTVSPTPKSTVNDAVTLSVAVAAPKGAAGGVPTGTVTFTYNDKAITSGTGSGVQTISDCQDGSGNSEANPVTLDPNGDATCLTHSLPGSGATTDSLSATYNGETNVYGTADSNIVNQTVAALPAALTFTAPPQGDSQTVGTEVTFTVQLSAAAGAFQAVTPSGKVSFKVNGNANTCGSTSLDSSQSASCSTANLVVPSDIVVASYAGDLSYTVSTNASFTEAMTQAGAQVKITSQTNPSVVNQQVTFTATVSPFGTNNPQPEPTGNVSFTPTTGASCSSSVGLSGAPASASCTYTFSAVSSGESIKATYSGDTNFTSSSNSVSQQVTAASTTIQLTPAPASPAVNAPVTFQVTVVPQYSGAAVPTGSVTVTDTTTGATVCPSQKLVGGTLTCPASPATFAFTTSGTHNLQVNYTSGDKNFTPPTTAPTFPVTVGTGNTSVTLTSSSNNWTVNRAVTFTATITTGGDTKNLSGSVAFNDTTTGATLCTATVSGSATIKCTMSQGFPSAGTNSVVAVFASSNNNFSGGTSNTLTQNVGAAATNTAVQSASPTHPTIGQSILYMVAVTTTPSTPATPAGTVTVYAENTTTLQSTTECTFTLPATTCSGSIAQTGSYSITATFTPTDTNFQTSTSLSFSLSVGQVGETVTLSGPFAPMSNSGTGLNTCTSTPVTSFSVNQPVCFVATVTPNLPGTAPTGTVTFEQSPSSTTSGQPSAAKSCTLAPLSTTKPPPSSYASTATCGFTFLVAGTYSMSLSYSGDNNFPAGSFPSGSQVPAMVTVSKATTSLAMAPAQVTTVAAGNPVKFSVVVTPTPGGAALPTGSVTFSSTNAYAEATLQTCGARGVVTVTDNPNGTAVASCTVTFPHVATPPGTFTVTGTYSGDGNFGPNTNTTGVASSVMVQDAGISLTLTPTGNAGGNASQAATTTAPAIDYVTQGFTNATDLFNGASIAGNVVTAGGFSDSLSFTCTVLNFATKAPVTDPSCSITPSATEGGSGGSYQALTVTVSASANAAAGLYTLSLQATDQTTPTFPALASQTINVYVLPVSGTLDLVAGASGTANPVFNTSSAPSGASLVSFSCPTVLTTKGTAANFTATCTGQSTAVTGAATTVPITLSFAAKTTGSAALAHSSMTMYAAAFATPFFATIVWLGSRKSSRRNFFRFLGMVLVMVGVASLGGCGGSYSGPGVTQNKTIAPGAYYVEVVAKDANGNSYYTVVAMVITA